MISLAELLVVLKSVVEGISFLRSIVMFKDGWLVI